MQDISVNFVISDVLRAAEDFQMPHQPAQMNSIYISFTSAPTAQADKYDIFPCFQGFLLQWLQHFSSYEVEDKIAQLILLLTGKTHEWATAVWMKEGKIVNSYDLIVELFCNMFPKSGAIEHLMTLKQG